MVTGNQKSDFTGIIKLLSERKPKLGGPLSKAFHIYANQGERETGKRVYEG